MHLLSEYPKNAPVVKGGSYFEVAAQREGVAMIAETEKWQQAVYCQRCGRFITMVHTASSTGLLTALFALRLGCVCELTTEEISSILLAPHGGCPAVRAWANRVKSALRALQLPEEEVQWATATMWPLSEERRLQMIRAREAKGKANE